MHRSLDVQAVVEILAAEMHRVLGPDLVGIYLRGSLVTGDFNPETSDIDLLIVVKQNLNQAEFDRLDRMHRHIQTLPNRYAHQIELAYLPVAEINGFQPGKQYVSLERGEPLRWKQLRHNWIVEFWSVREHGVAIFGPEPRSLIEPIAMERVVGAIRLELSNWLDWVETWGNPDWQTHAGEMRFAVETMCRALYTMERSSLCSKPAAVSWAQQHLAEPWPGLIAQSQKWNSGSACELEVIRRVEEFIRWTVAQA
jgi:predicted nucleotidyltransferase